MKKHPVIIDCWIQTALGNLDQTWKGLIKGESGLKPFADGSSLAGYPVGKIDRLAGEIGSAERFSALLHRGFQEITFPVESNEQVDLIIATTKAGADELVDSPDGNQWQAQPWNVRKIVRKMTGCSGTIETVSAACASGTIALIKAGQRIISGESAVVMVVGIDIISRFALAGFASLQALSPDPCRPFDQDRNGLSLGEGIGIIVITDEQVAEKSGKKKSTAISGWGVSCDARHITAPCREGSGLLRVLKQTTAHGEKQVGAINAHGTGTSYNDAMELTAFRSLWKNDLPPLHSVKGAIGHCLGGAGVIEAAIAVQSLHSSMIPPTVGLENPESCLTKISSTGQRIQCPTILSCNSGFGGINAGILLTTG